MLLSQLFSSPIFFAIWIFTVLLSITFHEFMHAWTANYLGDDTAKLSGRMTLNPLAHLDPFGSLSFLLVGIGWAKPVPVNPLRFKNFGTGEILTALSGPVANLMLAVFFSVLARLLPAANYNFKIFIYLLVSLNLALMLFNLLPIPPLDGSHILNIFIKDPRKMMVLQSYSLLILVVLIFTVIPSVIIPAREFLTNLLLGSNYILF